MREHTWLILTLLNLEVTTIFQSGFELSLVVCFAHCQNWGEDLPAYYSKTYLPMGRHHWKAHQHERFVPNPKLSLKGLQTREVGAMPQNSQCAQHSQKSKSPKVCLVTQSFLQITSFAFEMTLSLFQSVFSLKFKNVWLKVLFGLFGRNLIPYSLTLLMEYLEIVVTAYHM